MIARIATLLAAALAAASCGRGEARTLHAGHADSAGVRPTVSALDAEGRPLFVRRVDGDVTDLLRVADAGGAEAFLALTGYASGDEQCRVLVLSPAGATLASHRVSGRSPFPALPAPGVAPGETLRQLQRPLPGTVRQFRAGTRRFVSVATEGWWAPHAVEVLEVLPGRLVPRLEIWNAGSFCHDAVDGDRIAVLGLNNGFRPADGRPYAVGVGVVDLAALPEGEAPPRVVAFPSGASEGSGYLWYALLPESHGVDDSQVLPPIWEPGHLRVPMERGTEYRLGRDDGSGGPAGVRLFRPAR